MTPRVGSPTAQPPRPASAPAQAQAPSLRAGSRGAEVSQLQDRLRRDGFDPGKTDGKFGAQTRSAVESYQRARGLKADGVVGTQTRGALATAGGAAAPSSSPASPSGQSFRSRGTGYYPDNSPMEGGFKDRLGKPLRTLQDYLAGKADYVSVAMDSKAFPYGTKLRIPELEKKHGRPIEFRVVDTGGAFRGQGTSRIDICTANRRASLDPAINGPLTLIPQR